MLDAGRWEDVTGPDGAARVIWPPETTLFHQVLAYLRAKPDPATRPSGSAAGREGVAAAAVVLRWGSYLAVLLDRDKPLWSAVHSTGTSRISDAEMARINIEASAALAEWIDLYRADRGGRLYGQLVDRAVSYLPMPQKTSTLEPGRFAALADRDFAPRLERASEPGCVARARADAECHPSRVFAMGARAYGRTCSAHGRSGSSIARVSADGHPQRHPCARDAHHPALFRRRDPPPLERIALRPSGVDVLHRAVSPGNVHERVVMQRAFDVDVLACRACGGRLRLIATILDPATIRAILHSMAVATEAADRAPPGAHRS